MRNETELAWAAGFFDGEGSTSLARSRDGRTITVRMVLNQTRPEPLQRFQRAVGAGKCFGPHRKDKNPRHSPQWFWQAQSRADVAQVIECLWPYLSLPKREQFVKRAFEAQELLALVPPALGRWGHRKVA